MGTIIAYHCAAASDRESIAQLGLLERHPANGRSGAEAYGNDAGAAVYMWRYWGAGNRFTHRGTDVWAIEIDEDLVHTDPSELGPLGAIYTYAPVTPDMIERIGDEIGSGPGLLRPADLASAHNALAWSASERYDAARVIAERSPGLVCAWLAHWDCDYQRYRAEHLVAVSPAAFAGKDLRELGDLRETRPLVHTHIGATTVDDLLIRLYPLRSYESECFAPEPWEWALIHPEALDSDDRSWCDAALQAMLGESAQAWGELWLPGPALARVA